MVKKTCPKCGKNSYSAAEEGTWTCPYCKADMANIPAGPADGKTETQNSLKWPLCRLSKLIAEIMDLENYLRERKAYHYHATAEALKHASRKLSDLYWLEREKKSKKEVEHDGGIEYVEKDMP